MEISILGKELYCRAKERLPLQLLRVMKLTTILLIICCMHVCANSYSQTVSFSGKNVRLQAVFSAIEKQTGLSFFFNYTLIKETKPVTLDVREVPLEDALHRALQGQELDFYQTGKTIFIVRKEAPAKEMTLSPDQSLVSIKGRVSNAQGEPLGGASVSLKDGKKGVLTDEKGLFELKNIPADAALEISFTGYKRQEIRINGQATISVELSVADNNLDEVQVIAYGTTTQRLEVGDVMTVKAADIEKQPVSNPLLALEGQVPGLFITQSTGLPGAGVGVRIRGQNSITAGNDPFYVVDGVPFTAYLLPNLGSILGNSGSSTIYNNSLGSGSPFSYISPGDIESISVLKDADATAIYGSRAANGAILITTKKGKLGSTRVNLNLQNGWGAVTRKLKLMNASQYLEMRHEAIQNDGLAIGPSDYDLNGGWDTTHTTDWQKTLIGGTAQYTNLNATVSGGNSTSQYLVGGTWHRETTVFPGNFSNQNGSIHFNINSASANQRFKMQFSGNYLISNNQLPQADLTSIAMRLAPVAPAVYNTDGSLNWAPSATGNATWTNPLASLNNTYQNKTSNLISNFLISYRVLPGLDIKSSFGYTNLQQNEIVTGPLSSVSPLNRQYAQRTAQYSYNNINSWIAEPQAEYKRVIANGKLDAVVGMTIHQNNSNGLQLGGVGYNSDQSLKDILSATEIFPLSSTQVVYKYFAGFGRINYNWNDKYLIDFSIRRDGSSRFGSANQFHDFMAGGVGWIFSQEEFIKNNFPAVSFGKLRATYGTTGNDQIGDYKFLSLYTPISVQVPYQGTLGLAPNGLSNPYLEWEETKKMELGADLGFFRDKVLLNAVYYRNRSSNQLLGYALPITTGFGGITRNFPATIQNTGWEFTLKTKNIESKYFSWTTSINFTLPVDNMKLIAFPNLDSSSYATSYKIGKSLDISPLVHFLGVNPATGVYQFRDSHGNATATPDFIADATHYIFTGLVFYGGFENNFRYKSFGLDVLFQFVKKEGQNYFFGNLIPGLFNIGTGNEPVAFVNRWQKPGERATYEKYSSNFSLVGSYFNAIRSDAIYSDASFIRLKNLSLFWQIPESWCKKSHLQAGKLYLQCQNLLTISHYNGLDPETTSTGSLPPLRIVTFGLQMGL